MLLASCSGKSKMLLTVKLILPDVAMVGCAPPTPTHPPKKKIAPKPQTRSLKSCRERTAPSYWGISRLKRTFLSIAT